MSKDRYAPRLAVAPSTGPTMTVTTKYGAFPTDTATYVDCMYTLTGVPGQADIYAAGRIRGRGHNTWSLPKKPFKVKLDDTASFLGLPSSKDWALLANYNDPTAISNALAFTIGQLATGLPWTPHYGYVDLYFNGEYYGNFQLTETAAIATGRVNLTKATGTTGLALTGAYLMEINNFGADPPNATYVTTHGVRVNADDPDGTNATQWAYVSDFIQDFEDVLYGGGFADPTTGFRAWIDINSWIDWFLVEELAANYEAPFFSSCKIYKTRDVDGSTPGKLFMGPLWDFDRSFGVPGAPEATVSRVRPDAAWFERMFADATFEAAVAARWTTLKAAITTAGGIDKLIDRAVARVAAGQHRDAALWDFEYEHFDLMTATKAFTTARLAWMNGEYV